MIKLAEPRPNVEIHLPDGRVYSGPRYTVVGEFLKALPERDNPPIMGAIVNGELRELTYPIDMDANVKPVTMGDADGARIYRRSITFLLEAAFEDLFSGNMLRIDHSISSGGFYCRIADRAPLTKVELSNLERHMRELITADLPFERHRVSITEAIEHFTRQGYQDKVRLLKYRRKGQLVLYNLGEHRDYHHGYMVPSTGCLRWFALSPMGDGFILRYTHRRQPTELAPLDDYPKLIASFRRYTEWLTRLGIENVGALNDAISENRIREVILVSEALQEREISEIAEKIVARVDKTRIVLIAGPSSSGKTTFSKRLVVQLLAQGLSPFALEMDNYFVDREKTPLDHNGEFNFEAFEALDVDHLGLHLQQLVEGKEVQMRRFDFKSGVGVPGETIQLAKDQVIILEGIHGLNPRLLSGIPVEKTFRIYVSCLAQLNLDRYNRISTTDSRLLRRIVRDARERGYTAQQTIQRWTSVRRGESQHIFPYQERCDVMFNSALVYELAALRKLVEPLIRQVVFGTPEYIEAKRLLAFLDWFQPIETNMIPDNSILREFIGGSILKDFTLWQNRPAIPPSSNEGN